MMRIALVAAALLICLMAGASVRDEMAAMERYCTDSVDEHPDSVLAICARLEQLARAHNSDEERFTALKWKSNALGRIGIFDEALKALYDMARMLETKPALDYCGETYKDLAMCYEVMNDYEHGFRFSQQYLSTAKKKPLHSRYRSGGY